MLIVLALIIVLTTMYWGFGSSANQHRQLAACEQNLEKIHIALELYANDSNGRFPVTTGARTSEAALAVLVPRYTSDTSIFICPGSKDAPLPEGEPFRDLRISYAYYMGEQATNSQGLLMSDRQVDTRPKDAGQYAFSETGSPPGNNHHKYGGNFLFCDGDVKTTPARVSFALGVPSGVVLLNPKP
jgi:hypothetical protein